MINTLPKQISTKNVKRIICLFTIALLAVSSTFAAVTITKPSLAISSCSVYPTDYHTLGNIVIAEPNGGAKADFSVGTNVTLILTAPTNFAFLAGTGDVSFTTGMDITAASMVVTATTITVTYTCPTVANVDVMTISNVQLRAAAAQTIVNITRTGGTGVIAGLVNTTTVTTSLTATTVATLTAGTTTSSITGNVCVGTSTTIGLSGSTDVAAYQWQSSTDNVTFTNISGATSSTYTYTPTIATTIYYRCTLTCGTTGNSTSLAVPSIVCDCFTGGCTADVVTVNLSANADSVYTYSATRNGICCGITGTRCIKFNVTTNPQTTEIGFNAVPTPSGNGKYSINCSQSVSIGTPACVTGQNTFCIVYCKSGGETGDYTISASKGFTVSNNVNANTRCPAALAVTGLVNVTWNSVSPGASGAYNGRLSALTGNNVTMTPIAGDPSVIKYLACGQKAGCGGGTICDTVRVLVSPALTVTHTPAVPVLCSGGSGSITLATTVSGGATPYTYSWSPGGQTTSSISVNTPGTYIASVSDATVGCTPQRDTIVVTSATTPTMTSANAATICSGGTVSIPLTSNVASTYTWIATDNTNVSGESLTTQTSSTLSNTLTNSSGSVQTVTYTVTPNSGGCIGASQTVTVTVQPTVTMSSANSATICNGATVSIPLTSNVASSYSWIAADNANTSGESLTAQSASTLSNTITNSNAASQNVIYTVTPTSTSGSCVGTAQTVTVTVRPEVAMTSANSATICNGAAVSIPLTSNLASSYTWIAADNTNTSGESLASQSTSTLSNTITNSSTSAQNVVYTVTPTSTVGSCVGTAQTVTVTVNPAVTMTSANSATICNGATVSIPLTSNVASSYTWIAADNTNTSGESTASQSTSTLSNTITNSSTSVQNVVYTVTPTSTSGSCAGTAQTVTVSVNPTVTMTSANSATICNGATVSIPFTSNLASSYTWIAADNTNTSGESLASQSTSTLSNTITNSSTSAQNVVYTVTPTSTSGSCAGTAQTVTVSVNPTVTMTSANSAAICNGATVSIPLTSNVASSYTWIAADNTNTSGESTASQSTSTLSNTITNSSTTAQNVIYTVTPTSTSGSCAGTAQTVTVTVNPTVTMTSANSATICNGAAVSIPLTSNVASSYTWIAADNTNTSGESLASQSTSTLSNTITNSSTNAQNVVYTVTPTSTSGSCAGTAQTVTVTVNPTVTMTSANSAAICNGATVSIPLTSNVASSYTWIAADNTNTSGESTASQSTSTLSNTITNSSTTAQNVIYTVTPTSTSGSCAGTAQTVTVTVNPTVTMTSANSATICNGAAVSIPLTSNVAASYTWIAADNTNTSGESLASQSTSTLSNTITNSSTTAQNVVYTVTPTSTSGSCAGTAQTVTVTVNPTVTMTSANSAAICNGATVSIPLTSNVASSYTWIAADNTNTSGESLASQSTSTLSNTITNSSTTAQNVVYTVTPTSTSGSCAGTAQTVTVSVNPTVTMTSANSATICNGATVSIPLTSNVAASYTWIAADNTNTSGESLTSQSTSTLSNTITNSSTSVQNVVYTVTPTSTSGSCAGTAQTVTVTVNPTVTMTSANSATICNGATVSIPLTSNVASSYTWIAADNTNTSGESTASQSTSTLSNTITNSSATAQNVVYTVTPTSTSGSCAGTAQTVTVSVNPAVTMTSANSAAICNGATVSIPLTSNVASSYTWIAADNANTSGESLASQSTSTLSNTITNSSTTAQNVVYTVTPTSTSGSCAGTAQTVTVTVNPTVTMTSANSAAICNGATVSIPLTSNVASSYTWIAADNTNTSGESLASQSTSTLSNTITNSSTTAQNVVYTVTPTSTSGSCAGTAQTVTVSVNPAVTMTSANSAAICNGATVSIPLTSNVASSYTWIAADNANTSGESLASQSTSTLSNTITNSSTTAQNVVYTVTPTSTSGSCAGTAQTVTVTVNPTVTMTSANSAAICNGATVSIPLTSNVASSYTWIAADNTNTSGESLASQSTSTLSNTITNSSTTAQNVVYTVTPTSTSGSCAGTAQTVTVSVNPTVTMTSANSATICNGATVSIPLTSNVAASYTWIAANNANTSGESTTSQSTSTLSNTITNSSTTVQNVVYTVTPTSTSGSCAGTAQTVTVSVNPAVTMTSASSATICSGATVSIPLTSNIPSSYTWVAADNTNTSGESLASQSTSTLSNTITNSNTSVENVVYTVTPTSTSGSCAGTAQTVTVSVNPTVTMTSSNSATICSGATVSIPLTSNIASSYSWIAADNTNTSGESLASQSTSTLSNTITNSSTTAQNVVYTVTPTSTSGSCAGTPQTVTVSVNPIPAVTSASTGSVCSNVAQNYTITSGVAGTTYSWSRAAVAGISNGTVSAQTSNPITETLVNSTNAAVDVTYVITPTAAGCSGSPFSYIVTVNPTPNVTATPSSQTICSGTASAVSLTSNVTGSTFNWTVVQSGVSGASASSGSSIAQTLTATGVTAGTATYTITPTATSCPGSSITTVVTVSPTPVVTATPSSQTICSATAASISLTSNVTGTTFAWTISQTGVTGATAGSGSSISQTLTTTGAVAGTATYTITPTASTCAGAAATATVTVNPIPAAPTASSNSAVCLGGTLNLTAANVTNATYAWTGPASFTSALQNPSVSNVTAANAGTYSVHVMVDGCTGPNRNITVIVNPPPTAPAVSANSPVCTGQNINLTVATITAATYSWTGPNGFTSAVQNPTLSNVLLVAGGTYSVTATVPGCGSSSAGTVTVTVNQTPSTPSATSNSPICAGATLNLTTANVAGATYNWTGPNSFTDTQQNPSISNATTAATGTYSVTVTKTGCTSAAGTVAVTVNPIPLSPNAGSNSPLCAGSSVALTASTVSGATYSWSGPGFTSALQNPSISSATTAASGTYSVVAIVAGCSSVAATTDVVVNPIPAAPTASGNTICQGSTDTLTATAPGGTYDWYNAASAGTLLATGATFVTPVLNANTTYYVQTTVSGCVSPRTAVTVTASPIPAAPTVSGTTTICEGLSTTLNATAPGGTYQWYDAATGGTLLSTGAGYTTAVLSATTNYYVNTTIAGCTGPMKNVTVNVTPTDDPSFNYSSGTYCVTGTNPTPTITGGFTGTFSSSPAGLVFLSTSTGAINLSASSLNTYTITFTTSGPCQSSSSVNVTITNAPNATFAYSGPFCESGTNPLPSFSGGASAGVFTASPSGLTFVDAATGEIALGSTTPGTYTITNNIVAAGGCAAATASGSVTVNPKATVSAGSDRVICAGTTVTLAGSYGGSASGVTWSGGTGGFSSNSDTSAVYTPGNGEALATLIITTNDPTGPCGSVSDTMTITINPIPAAPTALNDTICQGTATTLTATAPGGTYEWYSAATGGTLLATNAAYTTPTLTANTTYYVQTTMLSCISPRTAVSVTINPTPAAPTAAGIFICTGTAGSLTATAPGGIYQWYDAASGGTLLATSANYTTPVLTATTTYYVQSTISGCTGPRKAVVVTVSPVPAAPTVADINVCTGSSGTFTATAPGGTYQWYDAPAGGTLLATNASYTTPALTIATTYYVQTTITGCAGPRAAVTANVNPIPSAPTAAGATICQGTSATLTATAPGETYAWYSLATGGTLLVTNASYTTPSLANTTTYYVQTTIAGCTSPRTAVTVTVTPTPATPTASNTSVCNGNPATLTATAPGGTYEWYDAATAGSLLVTNATYVTPNLTATTTYYVQTTVSGCTSLRKSVTVTVNPIPAAPTAADVSICTGNTATLTATAPGGTYAWYDASVGGILLGTNASYTTPVLTASTDYYVQSTILGCTGPRTSVTVTVNPIPSAPTASGNTICAGLSDTLTATAPGGTYQWYSAASGGSLLATNSVYITPVLSATTTYYVQTTVTGCTSPRTAVTVNVNPIPAAPVAAGSTICEGSTATLTATSPGGTYNWYNTAAGGIQLITGASYTTPVLTDTVTYYVNSTIANCTGPMSAVTVNVTPTDDPSFNYSSGTFCSSGSNPIPVITGGFTGTFSSSPAGLTFVSTSTGEINAAATSLNTYTITFTTNGPCPSSSSMNVTITDAFNATFAYSGPYCQSGANPIPSFNTGASAGTFSAVPAGLIFVNNATGEIDLTSTAPGTYTITNDISASGGCAATTASSSVTINPTATVSAGLSRNACVGSSVTLAGTIGGSATSATWSGGTGSFSNSSSLNAVYTPGAGETFAILTLTTNDPAGPCGSNMDTMTVRINPIPSAPVASGATICQGSTATLTATAPGGTYKWYDAATNGSLLITNASYTTPALATTTNYYVQTTVSGCNSPRTAVPVTVIPAENSAFSYSAGTYCSSASDPTPTITGVAGGVFSASPAGLTFVSTATGEIDLSASTLNTYSITYTTNGTCPTNTSVNVTVTDAPDATFSYNGSPYCQSGINPLPVFNPGASAGVFSAPVGLVFVSSSTGEINLNTSTPGTYTITNDIVAAGGCASATANFAITIDPKVTVNANSDQTICIGSTATLAGTIGGSASTVLWSGGAGYFSDSTSLNAIYTPHAGETTVTLTLTTNDPAGPCSAGSDIMVITLQQDTSSFSYSSGTFCATGSNPLPTINGGYAGTFSATPAGLVFISNTTGEINVGASALNTYAVTFTSGGTCPNSTSMNITVTNAPDATFSYSGPYCPSGANPSPTFNLGASAGVFSAVPAGLTFVNNFTGEIDLTATAPGTYTLTNDIAAAGGCAAATASSSVIIDPPATVNAGSNHSVCQGSTVTLTGAVGGSATSAMWSGGAGYFSDSTNLNAVYIPAAGETSVTLTLTSNDPAGPCGSATDNLIITINPIPASPTVSGITICEGTSDTLTATAPGGIYQWYDAATGGTLLATNQDYITPVLNTTTTYYVQATVSGCTSIRSAATVTVNPSPVVNAGIDQVVCANNPAIQLSGTITNAGGGKWSTSGTGGTYVPNDTTLNAIYTPSAAEINAGTISFVLSSTTNGTCAPVTDTMIVTFSPAPIVNAGSNQFICKGTATALLNGSVNGGATTGHWTTLGSGTFTPNDSTLNATYNLSTADTTSGSVQLVLTATNFGNCNAVNDTVSLMLTSPAYANVSADVTICSDVPSIAISGNVTGGSIQGVWTTSGSGTFSPDSSALNATYTLSASDISNGGAMLTLTPVNSCMNNADSMQITIEAKPVVNAGSNMFVCNSVGMATLNGSVSGVTTTGIWTSSGGGAFSPNDSTLNAVYTLSSADTLAGSVVLTLTSTNNGSCGAVADSMVITTVTSTSASVGNDISVCSNTSGILLSGIISGGSQGTWTTNGGGTFTPSDTVLNPTYTPDTSDINNGNVILTLTPAGGCNSQADSLTLIIDRIPVVNAGSNHVICANVLSVNLNGTITGGTNTGQWTTSGSGIFTPNDSTLNATYNLSSADTAAGNVKLWLTSTHNGSCGAVIDSTIITITTPAIAMAGSDTSICSGTSALMLSGMINGGTGQGIWTTSGNGTFAPDSATLNATYSPGTSDISNGGVVLTLTPVNACQITADSVAIIIDQVPVVNAGSDITICNTINFATLNGSVSGGATLATWTTLGTGIFSPSADSLDATYTLSNADSIAGSVSLVLTSNNNGSCAAVSDTVVINTTVFTAAFAGNDTAICGNTSVLLAGIINGGSQGIWTTNGDGTFSPDSVTLNASYIPGTADISNGNVMLTLTPSSGCQPVSDSMTVNINAAPIVNAGSNIVICDGSMQTSLNGNISGGTTSGQWTTSGTGSFSPNDSTLNASYNLSAADTANGSVTLTLTSTASGICGAVADSIVITITPSVNVNAGNDTSICAASSSIQLNGSVNSGLGMGVWSTNGTGTFAPNDSTLNAVYTYSTADISNGSVTLTLQSIASGQCLQASDSILVTFIPAAIVNAGSNIAICNGSMVSQLNGSVTGGSVTGQWSSSGSGTFSPNDTTLNATYNLSTADTSAGSVTLTLASTNNGSCGAVTNTLLITTNSVAVTFAGNDTTICADTDSIGLNGSVTGSSGMGRWTTNGTGTFAPNDSVLNASYQPGAADLANGSVVLTLTSINSCVNSADSLQITFNAIPSANAGSDQTMCSGGNLINLTGAVNNAGGGQWTSNGTGTYTPSDTVLAAGYTPAATDADTLVFVLTTTGSGSCSAATDTMIIYRSGSATGAFTVSNSCSGQAVNFTDNSSMNGGTINSWYWNFGNGDTSTAQNPVYTYSSNGAYQVSLVVSSGGSCADTVVKTLYIHPIPVIVFNITANCESDSAVFTNTSSIASGSISSWTWNFGDGNTSTVKNPHHLYNDGTYTVGLTAVSDSGCSASLSQSLTINPSPVAGFSAASECLSLLVNFTDTSDISSGSISSYNWNFGDGSISTVQSPAYTYGTAGNYTVTLQVLTAKGCGDSIVKVITTGEPVTAEYIPAGGTYDANQSISFTNQSAGASTYSWNFGDGTDPSTVLSPEHSFTSTGTYSVILTAMNSLGCIDTVSHEFIINSGSYTVPTGFSPNGDGLNDYFYIKGGPFSEYELRVFNEWGREIFMSTDQNVKWDGTYKGVFQPAGTFIYIFNGKITNGESLNLNGEINIIR